MRGRVRARADDRSSSTLQKAVEECSEAPFNVVGSAGSPTSPPADDHITPSASGALLGGLAPGTADASGYVTAKDTWACPTRRTCAGPDRLQRSPPTPPTSPATARRPRTRRTNSAAPAYAFDLEQAVRISSARSRTRPRIPRRNPAGPGISQRSRNSLLNVRPQALPDADQDSPIEDSAGWKRAEGPGAVPKACGV